MLQSIDIISASSPHHLELYAEAFAKNGSPKKQGWLEWMHYKNLLQDTVISMAVVENKAASLCAILPVPVKVKDEIVKACQNIDLLTDVAYRGKGLFFKVVASLYDDAAQKGYKFLYGFPNNTSVNGFIKNLKWKLIDEVPFLMKPLKSKYFTDLVFAKLKLPKVLPNINLSSRKKIQLSENQKIEAVTTFTHDFTELWKQFSKNITIAVNRDATYLNWRYKQKPQPVTAEQYNCAAFFEDNELKGYVVYCAKEKHNGRIGYIMELVFLNSTHGASLIQHALNFMIDANADAVLSWCMPHSSTFAAYKHTGFKKLSEKLRPIKLYFGGVAFDKRFEEVFYNPANWYLSYSDSDTV